MSKEIYNEGRVVGLSAYEIFCRNVLENDPTATVPSEHEWLASNIGMGASMVLKLPTGTSAGVHTYPMPSGSTLSAAGVVVATPFNGNCAWSGNWATKVISYGGLILNNDDDCPTSSDIPYGDDYIEDSATRSSIAEYLKIQDGIVYQQGEWIATDDTPTKDLINPDFANSNGVVRIYVAKPLTSDVRILLTGFTNKWVLSGISGLTSGSTDVTTNNWKNGGMLGPAIFPWASKIMFTVPSSAYHLVKAYSRKLPGDATVTKTSIGQFNLSKIDSEVDGTPVIDMTSADPLDYYVINSALYENPVLVQDSSKVSTGDADNYSTLATWYPGMSASRINAISDDKYFFPPALYGIKVSTDGTRNIVPIDVAAPGTLKVFNSTEQAGAYVEQVPDNFAMYHDETADGYYIVSKDSDPNPSNWNAVNSKVEVITNGGAYILKTTAGSTSRLSVSLSAPDGSALSLGSASSPAYTVSESQAGPYWGELLTALAQNKTIDILGSNLRAFRSGLPDIVVPTNQSVKFSSTATLTLTSATGTSDGSKEIKFGVAPKSGTNYVTMANGLRLYIANQAPSATGVPIGSIGIGW